MIMNLFNLQAARPALAFSFTEMMHNLTAWWWTARPIISENTLFVWPSWDAAVIIAFKVNKEIEPINRCSSCIDKILCCRWAKQKHLFNFNEATSKQILGPAVFRISISLQEAMNIRLCLHHHLCTIESTYSYMEHFQQFRNLGLAIIAIIWKVEPLYKHMEAMNVTALHKSCLHYEEHNMR